MADDLKKFVAHQSCPEEVGPIRNKFHLAFQMKKLGCAVTVTVASLFIMIVAYYPRSASIPPHKMAIDNSKLSQERRVLQQQLFAASVVGRMALPDVNCSFAAFSLYSAFQVDAVKNVAYFSGLNADTRHRLDIYRPKRQRDFPVLVLLHGGEWQRGDKQDLEALGRTLARNGIITVVPNYRLTPQIKHPDHIQDVAKAIAWTYQNAWKYGGNDGPVFVSGYDAGAHMAALLATDATYLNSQGLSSKVIKGVIPISGLYQPNPHRNGEVFGDEGACRQASPQTHIKGKHPPFLFLLAENDIPECSESTSAIVESLQKNKSEAAFIVIKGRDH